ncbi:hypothetical protein DRJ48_04450 [Candidatus Woesearchaeota archaeon]|nr:MAG: hypothetical protein DRJ48_04450 [Candidatus Woesearchaeota archaeon]
MNNRRPCAGPWKTPTIDAHGNLTVCCHDKQLLYKLGNLQRSNFDELWYGEKADELRKKHILGKFNELGDKNDTANINCANCSGFESPKISDAEVISYLNQTGQKQLIKRYLDRVCTGWSKIESLLIEVTDMCNLDCIMCRQKDQMMYFHTAVKSPKSQPGFMTMKLWKSILDDLLNSNLRVKALTPFWYGEPFMHPKIIDMLKYAFKLNYNKDYDKRLEQIRATKDKKLLKDFLETYPFNNRVFDYMEIHTNATLLSKKMLDYLFSKEASRSLGYLVFSVDALHESTYKRIRRGGDFTKVINNLKYALKLKSKLLSQPLNKLRKSVRPVIVIQFIVMPENYKEAEAFVDYWKTYLDNLGIPCQINAGYEPPFLKDTIFLRVLGDIEPEQQPEAWRLHEQVIRNSKYFTAPSKQHEKQEKEYIRRPCAALWKTPVVMWDGSLGVCCYDYKMQLKLGNINELKLSWLWNLDTLVERRLIHIKGEFAKLKVCEGCPNLDSPQMSDVEVVEYLRNIGKQQEILPYLRRVKNYRLLREFV